MRFRRVGVLLFIATLLLTFSVGSVAAQWNHETNEGAAVPMPNDVNEKLEELINDVESNYDVPDTDPWLLLNDQATYIVFSSVEGEIGEATVTGDTWRDGEGTGVIIAESTRLDTRPEQISKAEFTENPGAYRYKFISTQTNLTQFPYTYDGEHETVRQPEIHGHTDSSVYFDVDYTAQFSQYIAFNVSQQANEQGQMQTIPRRLWRGGGGPETMSHREGFWINDYPTTATGVILPRRPSRVPGGNDNYILYTKSTTPVETQKSWPDDVIGKSHSSVTFEADLYGTRTSAKEVLLQASACDGHLTIGAAPYCGPALVDTTLHTGVIPTEIDGEYVALPYIAVSNDIQDQLTKPEAGRFKVTGQIMYSGLQHPKLTGRMMMIYDMERVGETRAGSEIESRAREDSETVTNLFQEQVAVPQWEYEQYEDQEAELHSFGVVQANLVVDDGEVKTTQVTEGEPIRVSLQGRNIWNDGVDDIRIINEDWDVIDNVTLQVEAGEQFVTEAEINSSGLQGEVTLKVGNTKLGTVTVVEPTPTETPTPTDTASTPGGSVTTTTEEDGGIPIHLSTILAFALTVLFVNRRQD